MCVSVRSTLFDLVHNLTKGQICEVWLGVDKKNESKDMRKLKISDRRQLLVKTYHIKQNIILGDFALKLKQAFIHTAKIGKTSILA